MIEALDPVDLKLLDRWQRNFPLVPKPFLTIARILDTTEREVLARYRAQKEAHAISRIGAVFAPNTIGASTLAALAVSDDRLEPVAELVNREPGVNHNYEREHVFNLWFVLTGRDRAAIEESLARIRTATACPLIEAPLVRPFHLDLGFSLDGSRGKPPMLCQDLPVGADQLEPEDDNLIAALEHGLPISARPYLEIGRNVGLSEASVIGRLRRFAERGIVSRFGVIVRHRTLGYRANAMAVWDLEDERADELGAMFAKHPGVTLCYRRKRDLPNWPYNLFCMVHARQREDADAVITDLNSTHGLDGVPHTVLFSRRCFKQRGARYRNSRRAA